MSLSRYRMDASIAVEDMATALEFYKGKLGLTAVRTQPDGSAAYDAAGSASPCVSISGPCRHVNCHSGGGICTADDVR
jgi:hypothetical protein